MRKLQLSFGKLRLSASPTSFQIHDAEQMDVDMNKIAANIPRTGLTNKCADFSFKVEDESQC